MTVSGLIRKDKGLLKSTLLVLLVLNLLFAPKYRIFPYWTWVASLLGGLCLFDKEFRLKFGLLSRNSIVFFTIVCFGVLLSLAVPWVQNTYDFTYSRLQIAIILNILRGILLVYVLDRTTKNTSDHISSFMYIQLLALACLLYVCITLLFAVIPASKEFWLGKVVQYEYVKNEANSAFAFRYGIDGFAAFSSSTIFSIVIVLYTFVMSKKFSMIKALVYMLLALGCFFYGRIALVGLFLSILVLIVTIKHSHDNWKYLLFLLGVGGLGVLFLFVLASKNEKIQAWFSWSFGLVGGLVKTGSIDDPSFRHLFGKMYYLPPLKTLLIGDGSYLSVDGSYYGKTDVGFMRSLLFWGVPGTLINYASAFLPWYNSFRGVKTLPRMREQLRIPLVAVLLLLLVLEMKGEAFHRFIQIMFPMMVISFAESANSFDETKLQQ